MTRHYLQLDFPEINKLAAACHASGARFKMLECGCGVGNALYPLVARYRGLDVVCVDLSTRAIELVKVRFALAVVASRCTLSQPCV